MKREIRNLRSHRGGNETRTLQVIEQYQLLVALLMTWEQQTPEVRCRNHDYILKLRAKVRNHKIYLLNRADPIAHNGIE